MKILVKYKVIAIVLSILAIVSSVGACVFVVRRKKVRYKKGPTNSRLFFIFISLQPAALQQVFSALYLRSKYSLQ